MPFCKDVYPWLDEYLRGKIGVNVDYKVEWGWLRYKIEDKLFAAVCADGSDDCLITVKCEPDFNMFIRGQYSDIIGGYYCNKVHWSSIKPTGTVPDDIVREMCDRGYSLILSSFSKKKQAEILNRGTI